MVMPEFSPHQAPSKIPQWAWTQWVGLSDTYFSAPAVVDSSEIVPSMTECGRLDGVASIDVAVECAPDTAGRYLYIYLEASDSYVIFYEVRVYSMEYVCKY